MNKYDDIINIPHWEPKSHPRMSDYDRAAQFAPFAALTGYDAMIREESRLTTSKIDLDEEQMLSLNETLSAIMARIGEHPKVSIIRFRKDARKQGGSYVTAAGTVRDVDLSNRLIILKEGYRIHLDDIASIIMSE